MRSVLDTTSGATSSPSPEKQQLIDGFHWMVKGLLYGEYIIVQDIGYSENLIEFVSAIVILVVLVTIIGYRKRELGARYWVLAIIKIFVVFLLWQILSFAIFIVIMTYTAYYLEEKLFFIYGARTAIFMIFCVLLVIIEIRSIFSNNRSVNTSINVSG